MPKNLRRIKSFIFLLVITVIAGCEEETPRHSITGFAQGTTYNIQYWSNDIQDEKIISLAVSNLLASIDISMSNYRTDSTIENWNKRHTLEPQFVGSEIVKIIRKAMQVSVASSGCYDLTIKPLLKLWEVGTNPISLPNDAQIHEVLSIIGMDNIAIIDNDKVAKKISPLQIDLSSIAQGYSVSQIALELESQGVYDYLIEIGGELLVKGKKWNGEEWRIAIEKPFADQRSVEKVLTLEGSRSALAVMTSGTYRNYYEHNGARYSHVLDARTGKPVNHQTVSVTVLYSDATLADAWSTALLCLGKKAGLDVANKMGIPTVFIESIDNKLYTSFSTSFHHLSGVKLD